MLKSMDPFALQREIIKEWGMPNPQREASQRQSGNRSL